MLSGGGLSTKKQQNEEAINTQKRLEDSDDLKQIVLLLKSILEQLKIINGDF